MRSDQVSRGVSEGRDDGLTDDDDSSVCFDEEADRNVTGSLDWN